MSDPDAQRARFERRHEPAVRELLVLTGDVPTTSAIGQGDPLWTGVQLFQATLDVSTGQVDETPGRLTWLLPEGIEGQDAGLLPAAVRRVRARRALPPDPAEDPLAAYRTHAPEWALVEVLPTGDMDPRFAGIVARLTRTEALETPHGPFALDRRVDTFVARLPFGGAPVDVSLDTRDRRTTPATLAALDRLAAGWGGIVAHARAHAAQSLTSLANEWAAQGGLPSLTEAALADRLQPMVVGIMTDGAADLLFDDGEAFAGHQVRVRLDPEGRVAGADVV